METFALQLEKTKQETTGFRTEPRGKQGGVTFAGMTTSPNPCPPSLFPLLDPTLDPEKP